MTATVTPVARRPDPIGACGSVGEPEADDAARPIDDPLVIAAPADPVATSAEPPVVLRIDLTDAQFRTLWRRLQAIRPSLETFAPSPQLAASALEIGIGADLGDGWVEIRRLGGVSGEAWAVRTGGLDTAGVARLRDLLDPRKGKPEPTPEVIARRARRHRINIRVALALALVALAGLLILQPMIVIPT